MDEQQARVRLEDPATDAATLHHIAAAFPALRNAVAVHPNAYPELVAWIRSQQPPAAPLAPADRATSPDADARRPDESGRGGLFRTRWALPAAIGAGVVVLGGLGAAVAIAAMPHAPAEPPPSVAAPSPEAAAPSVKPSPRPTPTPTPTAVTEHPGDDWEVYGPILYRGGYDEDMTVGVSGPVDVYVPGGRGEVTLDATLLLPRADVESQEWTVAEPADGASAVAAVVVRNPAQGLDPSTRTLHLLVVPLDGGDPQDQTVATAECSEASSSDLTIAGSPSARIAVSWNPWCDGSRDAYTATVWDVDSSAPVASFAGSMQPLEYGRIVSYPSIPGDVEAASCTKADFVDITTATSLRSFDESALRAGRSCSYSGVERLAPGQYAFRSDYSNQFEPVRFGYDGRPQVWGADGVEFDPDTAEELRDPVTGLIVAEGSSSEGSPLRVWNPDDGSVVYLIDGQRVDDLGARAIAFFDGWLYLDTSDEALAVEVASGTVQKRSGTGAHPVAAVAGYVYLSDGSLVPASRLVSPLP